MSSNIIFSQLREDGDAALTNFIKYKNYEMAMTIRINKDKYQIKFYKDHNYNKKEKEKLEFNRKEFDEFISKNSEK